jgi:maleate isomerase
LDTGDLPGHAAGLNLDGVDGIVLSACVQMPSLAAVQRVQDETGLPVVTAATATVRELLQALGFEPSVPDAGAALGTMPVRAKVTT